MEKELPIDPLLKAKMAETPQNPRYHAEGDVLAHTEMVLRKYFELRDRFALTEEEKQVLYWAAVLHDVGKTRTTTYEDGRWRSPGHEKAGVPLALDHLLRQPELTHAMREQVLGLVRWHGAPLSYARYRKDISKLKLLGTRTDLRLLGIFSVFDFHGRICEDQAEILQQIEHFQQIEVPKAEYEFGKYAEVQKRYAAWNVRHKNAVWNAYRLKDTALLQKLVQAKNAPPLQTMGKKVILTVGPPASGKTTFLQREMPGIFRVDLAEHGLAESDLGDQFYEDRKLVEFKHFLTVYLNRHRQVVLDGRNLNVAFRRRLTDMIRDLQVEIEYLVFQSSLPILQSRGAEVEALHDLYASLDILHPWEAHAIRYFSDLPSKGPQ